MEKIETYEVVGPHVYRTMIQGEQIEIKMVWVKTNAILKKVVGMSTEIKDVLLALIGSNPAQAIELALASVSRGLVDAFFDEADEICRIALDEYDDTGKLAKKGNTANLFPEDIQNILQVVFVDVVDLLKNALRLTPTLPGPAQG